MRGSPEEPCTCTNMQPGGECVACEVWVCKVCLKQWGWHESGSDDDGGVCDECFGRDEGARRRTEALRDRVRALRRITLGAGR